MSLISTISLIAAALRQLAVLVPIFVRDEKVDDISKLLNTLANLGERGAEAVESVRADLEALVEKLNSMHGVSVEDREALIGEIRERSQRIQDAVAHLRPETEAGPSD
jgi:hypothetical protein